MKKIIFLTAIFITACTPKIDIYEFIQKDHTEQIPYTDDFDCKDFTETFIKNASVYGIDAFPVGVGWWDGDNLIFHQFVGVNTPEGTIWVEPQTDQTYVVSESGGSLCVVGGNCITNKLVFIYTKQISQFELNCLAYMF